MQRLWACARLDDCQTVLANAEAEALAGDESWEQWVVEYRRGEALIVCLELTVEMSDGETANTSVTGCFVENHVDAPRIERQIAELASDALGALGNQLTERGHEIDTHELGEMYVHVELDGDVRGQLAASVGQHTERARLTGDRPRQ